MQLGISAQRISKRGALRPRVCCFRGALWPLICGALMMTGCLQSASAQAYRGVELDVCVNSCSAPSDVDEDLLAWLNRKDGRFISGWMNTVDATFYSITFGSVPVYWGVSLLTDEVETEHALAFSAGWLATAGSTMLLKRIVKRKRPYVTRTDLIIRYSDSELASLGDRSSFPSGHTSMSVFLATYLAMEANTPPVRVVGGIWASSVALSRVWNGVHFPTDIAAGAALGAALAVFTHHYQ